MKVYLSVLCGYLSVAAALFSLDLPEIDLSNDSDLFSFVSRPDLRPPKFKVTTHHPNAMSTGYWFIAPYGDLDHKWYPDRKFSAAQVGPHIYDSRGELIWSGATLFDQRNAFDFKVSTYGHAQHLTFLLGSAIEADDELRQGAGILLDNTYTIQKTVLVNHGLGIANMHEFTVLDEGRRALMISSMSILYNLATVSVSPSSSLIENPFFQEFDINTGEILFEWKALDHILPSATFVDPPNPNDRGWDWFHMNSVEKSKETGDYLVSSRYTNAIYRISGTDGSVIWQLGGKNSSFLQDFIFSYQHDVRILDENRTTTIISFLDNASKGRQVVGNVSSVLVVALDVSKSPMTARLIQRLNRPDGQVSRLRGNAQLLSGGNIFVDWSSHGYLTEFSSDGILLQEARFASDRFVDYRAYKFNFSADPHDRPALKVYAYGISSQRTISVFYVSWNGATKVHTWNFYASPGCSSPLRLIGQTRKSGFETIYVFEGYAEMAIAEAETITGIKLRNSSMVNVTILPGYESGYLSAGCALDIEDPPIGPDLDQENRAFNPEVYLKSTVLGDVLPLSLTILLSMGGILAACWKLHVGGGIRGMIHTLRSKCSWIQPRKQELV